MAAARSALTGLNIQAAFSKTLPGFQARYQDALNNLAAGDYTQALESFLDARRLARTSTESIYAGLNALLAQENLGILAVDDLDAYTSAHGPDIARLTLGDAGPQYNDLLFRARFRAGDLAGLAALGRRAPAGNQIAYHLGWLASHPLYATAERDALRSAAVRRLTDDMSGYQCSFMLNTLLGVVSAAEYEAAQRSGDIIERLYLWTWQWLVAPTGQQLDKVLRTLRCIFRQDWRQLPADEYRMLACSVHWLAFFLNIDPARVAMGLERYSCPPSQGAALVDFEQAVLDALHQARNGVDFVFPALAPNLAAATPLADKLAALSQSFLALIRPTTAAAPDGIYADSYRRTISLVRAGKVTEVEASTPAVLLSLLAAKDLVSVQVVLKVCFQLGRYDAVQHDQKIAKLLSLTNSLIEGHGRLSRRGQMISVRLADGGALVSKDSSHGHCLSLVEDEAHQTLLGGGEGDVSSRWMSRKELEEFLGLGKTKTLAMIREWQRTGALKQKGRGKATLYLLTRVESA